MIDMQKTRVMWRQGDSQLRSGNDGFAVNASDLLGEFVSLSNTSENKWRQE